MKACAPPLPASAPSCRTQANDFRPSPAGCKTTTPAPTPRRPPSQASARTPHPGIAELREIRQDVVGAFRAAAFESGVDQALVEQVTPFRGTRWRGRGSMTGPASPCLPRSLPAAAPERPRSGSRAPCGSRRSARPARSTQPTRHPVTLIRLGQRRDRDRPLAPSRAAWRCGMCSPA